MQKILVHQEFEQIKKILYNPSWWRYWKKVFLTVKKSFNLKYPVKLGLLDFSPNTQYLDWLEESEILISLDGFGLNSFEV